MTNLEFVEKLYNGKNCYSDHMSSSDLSLIHIESGVEGIINDLLNLGKIVFLTGNPGDGKTYIIKALENVIQANKVYVETDLNNVQDYEKVVKQLKACYHDKKPAIIAVNEYPFMLLQKRIQDMAPEFYHELLIVKQNAIAYKTSEPLSSQIVVVDLNARNLLGSDYGLLEILIDKVLALLEEEKQQDKTIIYNLKALSIKSIKAQLVSLFELASKECEHFAIRDILGAIAFTLTAGATDELEGEPYYNALFESTNNLLSVVSKFDPVRLTDPLLDEKLWNGEIKEGWVLDCPQEQPKDFLDVSDAVNCFKKLKRKYYFENNGGRELNRLQPKEVVESSSLFIRLGSEKKKIKESLVLALNKLFLPSSTERKKLHIWTMHRYDMSTKTSVAVSSKSVESASLEILSPRPADWLKGIEYVPDHLVLKHKDSEEPRLILNIDFLRTLKAVEMGYPVGMLAPQYEQAAARFLQQLESNGLAEENEDGETILASRNLGIHKSVYIQDGKYSFGEEEG